MSTLRPYQQQLITEVYGWWDVGLPNILGVLPTGGGKSVVAAHVMAAESSASLYTAHRAELVMGESLALARNGVRHRVIGPPLLRRECSRLHVQNGLYDHIDPNARAGVGSVDTILNLINDPWLAAVRLVVPDEAAHILKANKWGRMLDMMVLAVTMTGYLICSSLAQRRVSLN
jgi:superfamily II DNA or RNA helicase